MERQGHDSRSKDKGVITKEFVVGLLAITLGGFNLASQFGYIKINFEIPQMIANVILMIAGLILWITAYKLWRYRWHSRRLF